MGNYTDESLPAISRIAPKLCDVSAKEGVPHRTVPPLRLVGILEGRGKPLISAPTRPREHIVVPQDDMKLLDHPLLGGKVTLFLLLYGDFPEMHRQCITAIKNTVPKDRIDWRIGSNALCSATRQLVDELKCDDWITCHYRYEENRKKYPVMRTMFHDSQHPITTKWLIWFDDDTLCNRNPNWLSLLARQIIDHWGSGVRMLGPERFFTLSSSQLAWVKQAKWYSGRPFFAAGRNTAPNGRKIIFASGSFWALHVDTMQRCDIPDARIGHNGGDYMIGAQLIQGGYKLRGFSTNKQIVNWSAFKRRGVSEIHVGKSDQIG